jgi:adenylate cyclase
LRFLQTKKFGIVLGLLVAGIILAIDSGTAIIDRLELRMLDTHFNLKTTFRGQDIQEGVQQVERNPNISEDILIVGIDFTTLNQFGQWPFPRYRHADLVNSFARITDQSQRERALFLDIFFIEPSESAFNDALLQEAMLQNERVFLETILEQGPPPPGAEEELFARHERLFGAAGRITQVDGEWWSLPYHLGLQPPLQPFGEVAGGYGHANFYQDFDEVYRRQALVARSSELVAVYRLDELEPGFDVDDGRYERLAWFDRNGREHTIRTPLTAEALLDLTREMEEQAPERVIDSDNDGQPDDVFYVVRHYQDEFIPAITLALAADYFNTPMEELEVVIGEHIRIPSPEVFDAEVGEWLPYRDEIVIPIDEEGNMLINFMGVRSSAARDGHQTFPVRPYAGYASRVPGPDPATWPRTRAVENKIIMVGAFAQGMAEDEKTTPYGLMYGVEIHANALNTILMNRFIEYAPYWLDAAVLVVLSLLVAFLASRLSTIYSFLGTFILLVVFFFATTMIFDTRSFVVNFTAPALGMIFSYLSVVLYRIMTEERDKRRIREMFGKYVSPRVVDQILANPPELGGVDKELTVFFSDIRGFTTLSEAMTPQELVNHLNVYLTSMTDIILDFQGTLDKYVGDEIMCFWGAPLPQPDHAYLACQCAVRQMEALNRLNSEWPEERRINIGIGVNSGVMTVGNMGSLGRMNYTLMGDNVNLGARLEGTNKMYGTNIIISEYTYGLVKDRVVARELDNIRVKGKNRPVLIYELVDVIDGEEGSTSAAPS